MSISQRTTNIWLPFWLGALCASCFLLTQTYNQPTFDQSKAQQIKHYAKSTNKSSEFWTAKLPNTTSHIEAPENVRGIYLSAWTVGTANRRQEIIDFITKSGNINTVIIDIKDSTGILSYTGHDSTIKKLGTYSKRIRNLRSVISEFHDNGIYVIGRVTAFEDPYISRHFDQYTLLTSDSEAWKNNSGNHQWIDPSNREYHQYLVLIAQEVYELGVDEINFDYVRYPSEGKTQDVQLPGTMSRADVIESFFIFLDHELRSKREIPISADVFGLTTTAERGYDMGIGQEWERIIPYVDYLCPMIYPSHYADGSFGFDNPADYPAEIVTIAVKGAIERTLNAQEPINKIRPWIQDFDLGARYDESKVRAQIESIEHLGVNTWLSWDPSNRYTQAAYTHLDSN